MEHFSPQSLSFESSSPPQASSLKLYLMTQQDAAHPTALYMDFENTQNRLTLLKAQEQPLDTLLSELSALAKQAQKNKEINLDKTKENLDSILNSLEEIYLPLRSNSPESIRFLSPFFQKIEALKQSNQSASSMITKTLVDTLVSNQDIRLREEVALFKMERVLIALSNLYFALDEYQKQKERHLNKRFSLPLNQPKTKRKPCQKVGFAVSFAQPKTPKNELEVTLPPQYPYNICLKAGYFWLQKSIHQNHQNTKLLKKSIRAFYAAVSAHPHRAGGYFGLATLYGMMEKKTRAQRFINLAQKYADFDEIQALQSYLNHE